MAMTIPLIVFSVALIMMAIEATAPGRSWPQVAGWWWRALVFNSVQAAVIWLAGVAWDGWMRQHRLWSADQLGLVSSVIIGYLAMTFVYYWWHRWRHTYAFLWRWFHQLHHSPQRIEIITSFYKHPFELLANGVLSSAILYLLVGLGPQAAAQTVLLTGLAELFYHWNVNTPYWLGFIVNNPESHCVHPQAGLHTYNYADLPVWDMLFGTFHNPRRWQARCGFGAKEHWVWTMLRGIDVTAEAQIERPDFVGAKQ